MGAVARIGDALNHGGVITSGAAKWKCNGIPIARVTDTALCALHGPVTIVTGSPTWICEGQPIARVGSLCSCGAVIISGSSNWNVT